AALEGLVAGGLAQWQERLSSPQGGRPTRECVLITQAPDETDETRPGDGPDPGVRPTQPPDATAREATETNKTSGNGEDSSVPSDAVSENRESGEGDSGPGPPGGFVGRSEGVSSERRSLFVGTARGNNG